MKPYSIFLQQNGTYFLKKLCTNFTINPLPNGLSDHDAQILILHNIKIQNLKAHHYTKD